MPQGKLRVLSEEQQAFAIEGNGIIRPAIAAFFCQRPSLRHLAGRIESESIAQEAVCMAAFTYDPARSKVTTYFTHAIHNAIRKACVLQKRRDRRFVPATKLIDSAVSTTYQLRGARAMMALQTLPHEHRMLLQDRLFENITLEQLAAEQRCDWRTLQKKITESINMLRAAELALP